MADELTELQREWRKQVTEDLKELREQGKVLIETMNEMKLAYATKLELAILAERVSELEGSRNKLIGGTIVLQAIGWMIVYLIKTLKW